jgi:hypothetical protein
MKPPLRHRPTLRYCCRIQESCGAIELGRKPKCPSGDFWSHLNRLPGDGFAGLNRLTRM